MTDFDDDHDSDGQDSKSTQVDRRAFGKILAAGVGGLALANVAAAEQATPAPAPVKAASRASSAGNHVDVVIVGGGLSGLIAARDLGRAGKTVRVLEAGKECGGRMTGQAINGGYLDFGGQWVGKTQYYMQELVNELKITPFDSYELGRSVLSYDGGTSFFNGDVAHLVGGDCQPPHTSKLDPLCQSKLPNCDTWPLPLRNTAEGEVWNPLLDISRQIPPSRPWDAPEAGSRDKELFSKFLSDRKAAGFTDWLPTMISRIGGSGGFQPNDVSTLHMAWTQRVAPQAETPEQWLLCGGAGQIPDILVRQIRAMQDALNNPGSIATSSPVRTIQHSESGVTVSGTDSNGSFSVTGSAVIVAVPPPKRFGLITFLPELPPEYRQFAEGSVMGTMSKVHAVYPEGPFWREECLSGSVAGNLRYCEFIADSSGPDSKKGPGILTTFITDSSIDKDLCSMSPKAAKRTVMDLVLGEYREYFTGVFSNPDRFMRVRDDDFYWIPWNCNNLIGGAFTSYPKPGIWTGPAKIGWREPYGSVFWAGTEASDRWPGYFDGAINAGKAAAQKVQKRLFEMTPNQTFEGRVSAKCPA